MKSDIIMILALTALIVSLLFLFIKKDVLCSTYCICLSNGLLIFADISEKRKKK